ncbi:hypothetical protein F5X68DRAFT_203532 [Plectosphaerella plurivora]|uniref:Secreted protein n=1 Tax=Plectosphaerella plurivora TaxID=936078 RepID=A0A9P8VFR3_9PEZI|nr:hypothetical protein F5X68DRAFT_203532 [Plectosphaerella plurivora]
MRVLIRLPCPLRALPALLILANLRPTPGHRGGSCQPMLGSWPVACLKLTTATLDRTRKPRMATCTLVGTA